MRPIKVILRQFEHTTLTNSNESDGEMADIVWESAELAGFARPTNGPIEAEEVRLSGFHIKLFCRKVMVLARQYPLSVDTIAELNQIIDGIEDCHPGTLVISRTGSFTTMRGIFDCRPGDHTEAAAAILANHEAERPAFRARQGLKTA